MNYTINISLPKQLAELAQERVKAGYYSSISEVIRSALRDFLVPQVPTFPLSKKAERKIEKALADHKKGKSMLLKSVDDLDQL